MVVNEHQFTHREPGIETAGCTGDDQGLYAQSVQNANRESNVIERIPLIQVTAALQDEERNRPQMAANQPSGMTQCRGNGPAGEFGVRNPPIDPQGVGKAPQPGSEDDANASHGPTL